MNKIWKLSIFMMIYHCIEQNDGSYSMINGDFQKIYGLKYVNSLTCSSSNYNSGLIPSSSLNVIDLQSSLTKDFQISDLFNSPTNECKYSNCIVTLISSANCSSLISFQGDYRYSYDYIRFTYNPNSLICNNFCSYQVQCIAGIYNQVYTSCCCNSLGASYGCFQYPFTQVSSTAKVTEIISFSLDRCIQKQCYGATSSSSSQLFAVSQYSGILYTNSLAAVLATKYFIIPDSQCSFSSCNMYYGTTIDTLVSVIYSGTALTATYVFQIKTDSPFSNRNLKLQCIAPGISTPIISNQISFTVNECFYTSKYPTTKEYNLLLNQNGGQMLYKGLQQSDYIGLAYPSCILSECFLVDYQENIPLFAFFKYDSLSLAYQLKINTKYLQSTKVKVKCIDLGKTLRESNLFSVNVTCGPKSVQVSQPKTFRQTISYQLKKNQKQMYIFDNFTSSDPIQCVIISHDLVYSPQNNMSLPQVSLIQGKDVNQFQILYQSASNRTHWFELYVVAKARGGAYFKSQIRIYNFLDCSDDYISLVQSFPDKTNQNYLFYKNQNQFPVLQIDQSISINFRENLKQRFTNQLSIYCPLQDFKIQKVICNNQEVSDYSDYFTISSSGILQTLQKSTQSIKNYLVFIKVYNGKIWGGNEKQYLADISLYYQAINLPQFIEMPQKQINIYQDSCKNSICMVQMPQANNVTSKIQIVNQNELQFLSVYYNQKNQSSFLQINYNLIKTSGEYSLDLRLINVQDDYQDYKIQLNIILGSHQLVSASITSIDQNGIVTLSFNDTMVLNKSIPWINYTEQSHLPFNNSWINKSNTVLKILPAMKRDQDNGFNESQLNFTWNVQAVTNRSIIFNLMFDEPLQISPLQQQDKLQIFFNDSQYLLASNSSNLNLDKLYWKISHFIKKQIPKNSQTLSLNNTGEFMKKLMLLILIFGILMNILGSGCVEFMLLMFRSLQMVLHLPIFHVIFPANALLFFECIFSVIQFDIQYGFSLFDYMPFIKYNKQVQPQVSAQMIDLGYDNRNAFYGMKTLTIVIFLYFTRVFLSLCTGILVKCIKCKSKYLKRAHCFLVDGIYFNQIIRISMEAYFEFFLIGYMNLQTVEFTYNGEKLGVIQTIFCLFMILVVLTSLSIFILFKSKQQLEQGQLSIKYFIGELYDSTKIENKFQTAYSLMFLIRRFSYLSVATMIQNPKFSGIQIDLILIINFVLTIYIGAAQAQKQQLLNQIEGMNEIFVQFSAVLLCLFTDYVQNKDIQFMCGWFMVASLSLHLLFNLFFIFRHIFKIIKQIANKIYNYINYIYDSNSFNFKTKPKKSKKREIELQEIFDKIIKSQKLIEKSKKKGVNLKTKLKKKGYAKQQLTSIENMKIKNNLSDFYIKKGINNKCFIEVPTFKGQIFLKSQKQNDKQNIQKQTIINKSDNLKVSNPQVNKNNKLTIKYPKLIQKKVQNKNQDFKIKFLENIRRKRLESQPISSIQDKVHRDFIDFLQNHKNTFKSCVKANNSYDDIEKDFKFMSYLQTDNIMQIRLKEIQITQYSQFQLIAHSNLDDPMAAAREFDKQLYKFTDVLISQIKQE